MNTEAIFFLGVIIAITVPLLALPFIPAWLEWKNKTDAEPFKVNFQDKTIVDYTIRMFREFIENNFLAVIKQHDELQTFQNGVLSNGIEYYIIRQTGNIVLPIANPVSAHTNAVFLFCKNSTLPPGIHNNNKIYACDKLTIGSDSTVKEVMTESDLQLDSNILVGKLLCSETSIVIGKDCKAKGYIQAREQIHFLGDAKFQYLYASNIQFGDTFTQKRENAIDVLSLEISRIIAANTLIIPANSSVTSHYVSKSSLVIEDKCNIMGNIKCYQGIRIGKNTTIFGSIFGEKDLYIDDDCHIQGPIVISGTTYVGKRCFIGSADSMTSLVTGDLVIDSGSLVRGLILAKHQGTFTLEK